MCTAPSHLPLALASAWNGAPMHLKNTTTPPKILVALEALGQLTRQCWQYWLLFTCWACPAHEPRNCFLIKAGEGSVLLHDCCPSAVMLLPGWTTPNLWTDTSEVKGKFWVVALCLPAPLSPGTATLPNPPRDSIPALQPTRHLFLALRVCGAGGEGKREQKTSLKKIF